MAAHAGVKRLTIDPWNVNHAPDRYTRRLDLSKQRHRVQEHPEASLTLRPELFGVLLALMTGRQIVRRAIRL
jgi:hypothetical protein